MIMLYVVINQILKVNNKAWIVNPYNELHGNIIASYNLESHNWNGVNINNNWLNIDILYFPGYKYFTKYIKG